ncbi:MAG: hypothetical protein WCS24_06215, partial [Methanoculleus sp.]
MKVEIGRCDVCGEKKAVYRSREAQVKVCEVRRFEARLAEGQEREHRRCEKPEHEKPSGFERKS